MASTDLRADSARDNPAPADGFTEAFLLAFDNWRLCDDPPADRANEISKIDHCLAGWQYDGARDAAARSTPQSASHAAIIAAVAHDELDTLLANHSQDDGFPPRSLNSDEIEALRLINRSLLALWQHIYTSGGELDGLADYFGLPSAKAPAEEVA